MSAGPVADQPVRPRTPPGVGTPLRADGLPGRRHPRHIPEGDRGGDLTAGGRAPRSATPAASEGVRGSSQTILLARTTRTMKRCSSDARSEGQSGDSLGEKV